MLRVQRLRKANVQKNQVCLNRGIYPGCSDLQDVEAGSSEVEWYMGTNNTSVNHIWNER